MQCKAGIPTRKMTQRNYYVYILASRPKGAIYIGVTSNLAKRIWEHRKGIFSGHSKKYDIHRLVYFEIFDQIEDAIAREKRLKKWRRSWKDELIEKANPDWKDLIDDINILS